MAISILGPTGRDCRVASLLAMTDSCGLILFLDRLVRYTSRRVFHVEIINLDKVSSDVTYPVWIAACRGLERRMRRRA